MVDTVNCPSIDLQLPSKRYYHSREQLPTDLARILVAVMCHHAQFDQAYQVSRPCIAAPEVSFTIGRSRDFDS
jgi:hypothetical protein